jgi:acyl-CoA thioesterase-1
MNLGKDLSRPVITLAFTLFFLLFGFAFVAMAEQTAKKIVVLGDSLVAGYGLGPGEAFPEKLGLALSAGGHDVIVENAGVSGDTSTDGLARLDWSVAEGTDLVIVELGANDALRGLPPQKTQQNLEAIIAGLQNRKIKVVLAGMLAPPNLGQAYEAEFNTIYPELADRFGVPLYPFFLDGVAAQPELNQNDAIHPNAAGVDEIVRRFMPFFTDILKSLP